MINNAQTNHANQTKITHSKHSLPQCSHRSERIHTYKYSFHLNSNPKNKSHKSAPFIPPSPYHLIILIILIPSSLTTLILKNLT